MDHDSLGVGVLQASTDQVNRALRRTALLGLAWEGYLFARALPINELTRRLQAQQLAGTPT